MCRCMFWAAVSAYRLIMLLESLSCHKDEEGAPSRISDRQIWMEAKMCPTEAQTLVEMECRGVELS